MARPRSDIGERILRAARARFLVDGVDGASLRSIARQAKTSIGMVYYYHPTKTDLFLAVVEQVYARLLDELSAALAAEGTTVEKLERLYRRVASLDDDEIAVVSIVVREAMTSDERRALVFARFLRGHIPLVLGALVSGVEAGDLRDDLPPAAMMIATLGLGLLPSVMRRIADGRLPFAALPEGDALAKTMVDVLAHGLARAPR